MNGFWVRVPLILGVVLFLAGLWTKLKVADEEGIGLLVLGSLLLGVWLTQEISEWVESRRNPDDVDGGS